MPERFDENGPNAAMGGHPTRRHFLGGTLGAIAVAGLPSTGHAMAGGGAPLVGSLEWIKPGLVPNLSADHPYPFSFSYGGQSSDVLLPGWQVKAGAPVVSGHRHTTSVTWTAPDGLQVRCDYLEFVDEHHSALDWVLWFSNPADSDSAVVSSIQALDLYFSDPIASGPNSPYLFHRTNGDNFYLINGPYGHGTNPSSIFQPRSVVVNADTDQAERTLTAVYGWPSFKDLPFFKVETGTGSLIVGLGWSGQWNASLATTDNTQMRIQAGMEQTNFLLHSNEAAVRSPRILLHWTQNGQAANDGDTLEANARFRQLIYKHYQARLGPDPILPLIYVTDSLSSGGWDGVSAPPPGAGDWDKYPGFAAAGELSLMNSFQPIGIDAYIQDATWYTGPYAGQPGSNVPDIGQWDVRTTDYPDGLGALGDQALANGLSVGYGVWFEAESARGPLTYIADSAQHGGDNWLLGSPGTYLVNFGVPGVIDYLVSKISGFVDSSDGYRCYWQDSNNVGGARDPDPPLIDELRYGEAANRQGINEIRHVMGMYDYWERLAQLAGGRLLRKECAGGGRRIDLETVIHMHYHQTSDSTGGNPSMDQAAVWGLSQYLPNSAFDMFAPYGNVYGFDSGIAATQNLNWDPHLSSFDTTKAKQLRSRHELIRNCVTGPWYPLTDPPDGTDDTIWVASQYRAADGDHGVVLAYRRASAPRPALPVVLRGLSHGFRYQLHDADERVPDLVVAGDNLMTSGLWVTLPSTPSSGIISYSQTTASVTPFGFLGLMPSDTPLKLVEQTATSIQITARYNLEQPANATIQLLAPDGWAVSPPSVSAVVPVGAGAPQSATFTVTPPAGSLGRPALTVTTTALGATNQTDLPTVVSRTISAVGTVDGSAHEFALYPDQWPQYLNVFPNGVDFTYGTSDPAKDWCYIQPGPDDAWGGSRTNTFTFRFPFTEIPGSDSELVFTAWLVDTNPSVFDTVDIGLNGSVVQSVTLSPGGGQGAWGRTPVIASSFTATLPTAQLQAGMNAITIAIPSGAWIVYDAFGVFQRPI